MATLGDINSKITSLTGADTNSYTNADRVIDINLTQQNVVGMILDSQDESDFDDARFGDFATLTVPLTTNRDYGIAQSEMMLEMKRVDVSYDGVNYYQATPIDSSEMNFGLGSDDTVDTYFTRTQPGYDMKNGSILLYPRALAADVSAGGVLRAEWSRGAKDFTESDLSTGTAVPGFDVTFHMMLAYGAALEYCTANNMEEKVTTCRKAMETYEARLRRQYGAKQRDRHLLMKSFYNDSDFE